MKVEDLKEARYHGTELTIRVPGETMKTLYEWMDNNNLKISPQQFNQALKNYLEMSLHDPDQIIEHIREWEEDIVSDV